MSIYLRNIRKSFGDKQVLKGIDADLKPGEVNMVIGSSGGGKTVLLKTMVGLIRPDEGTVMYDDKSYWTLTTRQRRALHEQIGMLFQGSALFDSMTVEENVGFPLATLTHTSRADIRKRVDYCLERVNMAGTNKLLPSELSGGMKKRVGIARAIVLEPKYLFFDEPNSGLDPQTAHLIDELIQDLTYHLGTTTLVISHDLKSVSTIGDHIIFLYKGEKSWEGSRAQLIQSTNEALNLFLRTSGLFS